MLAAFAVSLGTRLFFTAPKLELDIGLTSAVYGTLGTTYAVLIAFVVTGVWQSFTDAAAAVNNEANALTDLVFLVSNISRGRTDNVRDSVKAYVEGVVTRWDLLGLVTVGKKPAEEINLETSNELLRAVLAIEPNGAREAELYAQALDLTAAWLDARRNRLRSAEGDTAGALWWLLIVGAFVLFAFHGLFVAHSWLAWSILLLGLSLIIGLAFYLIFSLDSPFSGKLSVGPEPFLWLRREFHRTDKFGI